MLAEMFTRVPSRAAAGAHAARPYLQLAPTSSAPWEDDGCSGALALAADNP